MSGLPDLARIARGLDPGQHEREYNPRCAVPDVARYSDRAAELSAAARGRLAMRQDIRYGAGPRALLDVFPASTPGAPLHVFIHGGYWRGRHKSDYSYVAQALVPQGITTVVMTYDLCPTVALPDLAAQVRQGIEWVCAHAAELGGDPGNVTLSGHSAGAHLIACALAADAQAHAPLPLEQLRGALLISGIYELEPVLSVSVNQEIRLQPAQVEPMSPMRHPPVASVPVEVVAGGDEPAQWIAQSTNYAELARRQGAQVDCEILAGHHHFSIMTLLESAEGALAVRIARLAGRQA